MIIYLKLLFAMLVWGGTFTSARMLGTELDPVLSAFLRFLLASIVLLILLYLKERRFPRVNKHQFWGLFGMGLTGVAAYNLFFFYGLANAEASRGSLITATNPLFIALGAAFIFKEKFTVIRIAGFFLCLLGGLLIITRGDISQLFTKGIGLGELAFIGCVFSWASYSLIGRLVSDGLSSLVVIAYASCMGTVLLFMVALYSFGTEKLISDMSNLSLRAMLHLSYLAILATVVCFVWFQDGLKVLGAAKAGVFIYFMPVSAVFWAYLILDEKITLPLVFGAVLIISGIFLVNKRIVKNL